MKRIFCLLTLGHKYKIEDVIRSSGLFCIIEYGSKCVKCGAEVRKPKYVGGF